MQYRGLGTPRPGQRRLGLAILPFPPWNWSETLHRPEPCSCPFIAKGVASHELRPGFFSNHRMAGSPWACSKRLLSSSVTPSSIDLSSRFPSLPRLGDGLDRRHLQVPHHKQPRSPDTGPRPRPDPDPLLYTQRATCACACPILLRQRQRQRFVADNQQRHQAPALGCIASA